VVKGKKSLLARLFAGIVAIPEMAENYGFLCQPDSTSADGRQTTDLGWEIYPEGMLDALKMMQRYGRPLYVMENGIADAKDTLRPKFMIDHLKILDKAINEEKIDVKGYFHWALTDNYEWARGFSMKFGLCEVELKTKRRKERRSAKVYKNILAKGTVEDQ
jgi:beta-galactosidase